MANVDEVSKLKVEQLKELAAEHNVEVASSDKKDDLVIKLSDAISPEQLEAYNAKQEGGAQGDSEDSGNTDGDGDNDTQVSDVTPPVAANGTSPEASDEAYDANNQVNPAATPAEVREGEEADREEKTEEHEEGAKEVDTELGTSEEEDAAKRAGVPEERLNDPHQNREPKNEFEQDNQKVTEEERQAAQEVSNMTAKEREENSPTPNEGARDDAAKTAETNQGSDIANAIVEGLKASKEDKSIKIEADKNVEPRFSLVRNKQTGEVLVRENETRTLSKIQLESLEEKEANLQDTEVEEL